MTRLQTAYLCPCGMWSFSPGFHESCPDRLANEDVGDGGGLTAVCTTEDAVAREGSAWWLGRAGRSLGGSPVDVTAGLAAQHCDDLGIPRAR